MRRIRNSLESFLISRFFHERANVVHHFEVVVVDPLDLIRRHQFRIDQIRRNRALSISISYQYL